MMGERTVMQEALFYEFISSAICRRITCCAQSIGLLSCPVSALTYGPFTVRSGVLRSILSC